MNLNLIAFGKINEIIKSGNIKVDNLSDIDSFKQNLENEYPELKNIKYRIAINKSFTDSNIKLKDEDEIALLPPFSGG